MTSELCRLETPWAFLGNSLSLTPISRSGSNARESGDSSLTSRSRILIRYGLVRENAKAARALSSTSLNNFCDAQLLGIKLGRKPEPESHWYEQATYGVALGSL